MGKFFSEYLNKFMGQFFLTYPQEMISQLYDYFQKVKETLIVDIQSTYPVYKGKSFDDQAIFGLLQLNPCIEAVFYYRLERALFLKDPKHPMLPYLASLMRMKTGIELYYSTEIGPGINIKHGAGIVVGPRCKIGSNFLIRQGVTIGHNGEVPGVVDDELDSQEALTTGNNVYVFSGAKIIGDLRIGDNVIIGANAVLTSDAESNSVYAGVPARKIKSLNHSNVEEIVQLYTV